MHCWSSLPRFLTSWWGGLDSIGHQSSSSKDHEKEFEEFRVVGLRPMGVSVRTHLSSQDSQFNLFIGVSVEDMSRTVWMCVYVCVCVCVHKHVCVIGSCVCVCGSCVVSRREGEIIYKSAPNNDIIQRRPQHTKCAQVTQ